MISWLLKKGPREIPHGIQEPRWQHVFVVVIFNSLLLSRMWKKCATPC
jgi:hypothetical protein